MKSIIITPRQPVQNCDSSPEQKNINLIRGSKNSSPIRNILLLVVYLVLLFYFAGFFS